MAQTPSSQPTIVIIGAGVLGLSSAIKIQDLLSQSQRKCTILLVAKEWPAAYPGAPASHSVDYASMWAGAHVRPIPGSTPQLVREAAWLKHTVGEFDRIVRTEPWAGVFRTPGVELFEAPDESYRNLSAANFEAETGLPGFRILPAAEIPGDCELGFGYDSYCVNPPMYCSSLLRKFLVRGGKTLKRELKSEMEAFTLDPNVAFVVNTSGMGFGDPKCFPVRGQTVVTNLTSITNTVTRQNKDGSWNFFIPRGYDGGTIIGGTREPRDFRTEACPKTRKTLLENGLKLAPHSGDGDNITATVKSSDDVLVVSDIVGRRPMREGGMRLEIEEIALQGRVSEGRKTGSVIHAYGAGSRGYEMSWGIAAEVAELAGKLLGEALAVASRL